MKVTCLLGSPREKGNSTALARRFCETAERLGASVHTFNLNSLHFRGCQGCMACKTKTDKCVVKDDLEQVLETVREGDVLVLSSPVYMGDFTYSVRGFIERSYSYFVPDFFSNPNPSRLAPGKKLVFIQTQGQPNENLFADIFPRMEPFFNRVGFPECHLIRACGIRKLGEVEGREEIMKAVEQTAIKVAG